MMLQEPLLITVMGSAHSAPLFLVLPLEQDSGLALQVLFRGLSGETPSLGRLRDFLRDRCLGLSGSSRPYFNDEYSSRTEMEKSTLMRHFPARCSSRRVFSSRRFSRFSTFKDFLRFSIFKGSLHSDRSRGLYPLQKEFSRVPRVERSVYSTATVSITRPFSLPVRRPLRQRKWIAFYPMAAPERRSAKGRRRSFYYEPSSRNTSLTLAR